MINAPLPSRFVLKKVSSTKEKLSIRLRSRDLYCLGTRKAIQTKYHFLGTHKVSWDDLLASTFQMVTESAWIVHRLEVDRVRAVRRVDSKPVTR